MKTWDDDSRLGTHEPENYEIDFDNTPQMVLDKQRSDYPLTGIRIFGTPAERDNLTDYERDFSNKKYIRGYKNNIDIYISKIIESLNNCSVAQDTNEDIAKSIEYMTFTDLLQDVWDQRQDIDNNLAEIINALQISLFQVQPELVTNKLIDYLKSTFNSIKTQGEVGDDDLSNYLAGLNQLDLDPFKGFYANK